MLIYLLVVLIPSSFGAQILERKLASNQEPNNTIDVKLTKSVDIHLNGSNLKNWDGSINKIIQSQIHDTIEEIESENGTNGINDVVRGTRDSYSCQKDILDYLETINNKIQSKANACENCNCNLQLLSKTDTVIINYSEMCKPIVGISKPFPCQLIESEDNVKTKLDIPKSCQEIQENGQNTSGIYEIKPKGSREPFMVLCDMETRGGGWTVIQKRFDGSEDFYRELRDYKFGFGNLNREFWIGLENMYAITGFEVNELLVEITDRERNKAYANYKSFGIGPEKEGYPLNTLSEFSGDAGDSLTEHMHQKFSTKDMDRDIDSKHCAQVYLGAWWYRACHISNLNGKYINTVLSEAYKFKGLHWRSFRDHEYCHAGSRMLIRPVQL